ncbi:ferredoxin [Nocardioides marmotae]|uniref:ferredoxin n=1 Tax=Nocardioides marmotae TaxID=2663857 RepID=UPI0012B56351|nr:ferredoxin [Nocardioides marmotae]MBC9732312.1 ferredoxin [Nocardioides marmotae]MTB83433.1 ferredoxin [Nocardioides marmotae]
MGAPTGPVRIAVDRDLCEGLGMCEAMASDYFELDDDEVMHVLDETPAEADRGRVHAAVEACPVLALRLAPA